MFYNWVNRLLVIIIVVLAILAFVEWNEYSRNEETEPILGSFDSFTYVNRNEVIVGLGNFSQDIHFSDCQVLFVAPDGQNKLIELYQNVTTYDLEYTWSELTSFCIGDNQSNGMIDSNDYFLLFDKEPLKIGSWKIALIYSETNEIISERDFIIPDPRFTPLGSFQPAIKIDDQNYWVEFGIINPQTAFYYCQLALDPPDSQGESAEIFWNLNEKPELELYYNDSISLKIVRESEDGIITTGDFLSISTTEDNFSTGIWSIALIYSFTGDIICYQEFEVAV